MKLGYNTNGLAHHDPLAAIELLAQIGYQSVAITIDHHCMNPLAPQWHVQLKQIRGLLARHGMRSVIETGARYLLDPRVKHEPTLVSAAAEARERRVAFLKHAVDVAAELASDCVSLWSGVMHDDADEPEVWQRLVGGLQEVLDYTQTKAALSGAPPVVIGFEPEPGMFIDTMACYAQLAQRITQPNFALTLDVGHLHCLGEVPLAEQILRWAPRLVNVHIEDMRAGAHEHLMFGEGEIDFPSVLAALAESGYQGGVHVELSRHSHDGPRAAQQAFDFLRRLIP